MIVKKLEFNRKGMNAGMAQLREKKKKYNKTEPNNYRALVNSSWWRHCLSLFLSFFCFPHSWGFPYKAY